MALETERLRKHDLYKKHRDYTAIFTFFNILTPPTALWSKNQMVIVSWKFQMEVYGVFQACDVAAGLFAGSGIAINTEPASIATLFIRRFRGHWIKLPGACNR
jgi:hypothetical protein